MKRNTNNEVYKIIDTTKVHKLVSVLNIQDSTYVKEVNTSFLKFYSHGKVGKFYIYDVNDVHSLHPKKAIIGVYRYSKGKVTIQTYLNTAQGGGFVKDILKKSTANFLEFGDEETSRRYRKINVPKAFLIYSPDW